MGKKTIKKSLVFGAVIILLSVAFFSPLSGGKNIITVDDGIIEGKVESENRVYKVAVGPPGARSSDECKVIMNLSEEEVSDLKERFFTNEDTNGLSTEEIVEKKLKILREYNILPPEFTVENINKLFRKNGYQSDRQFLASESISSPGLYVRFGPTIYLYASFMSQYTYVDDSINKWTLFNMTRANSILENIFNISNPIFDYFENISLAYYTSITTWQIGIGGSLGFFTSFGPTSKWSYYFYGPFLGIFIFPLTLLGIYIFSEIETPDYPGGSLERPIFDFMINVPIVFSLVVPRWYADPENQP